MRLVNHDGRIAGLPGKLVGIISDESIRRVLEATDIVDLINSYVPLKRAGANWKGVCPFHNDTHPSMTVNPVRQSFMCFACQTGGDALTFVRKYEGLNFVDALKKLSEKAGIILIEEKSNPEEERARKKIKTLIEVNKMTAEFFHTLLKKSRDAKHARDYLNSRGYGADMATRWNVGWAPLESSDLLGWAGKNNIPVDMLIDAGLASKNERGGVYARFRDRLMFPINNDRGECVGFSGRLLREASNTGKYVNSPETPVFKKSHICFALDKAQKSIRDKKCVLLCEGQMDVIACHEAGVDFAVASLGTALTKDHAKLLKKRTDKVILCFDSDAAGIKAADKAFKELASEGMEVQIVRLPKLPDGKGDDPDAFIKREGAEAFHALLEQATPFIAARIEDGRRAGRMKDAAARALFVLEIADLVSFLKDDVARGVGADDAATRLQIGADDFKTAVNKARKGNQFSYKTAEAVESAPDANIRQDVRPMIVDRPILILCQLALQDAKAQALIADRIEDLFEGMEMFSGGAILRRILQDLPDPADPVAIHSFIRLLPKDQAMAVMSMNIDHIAVKDVEHVVAEACSGLANAVLEKQLKQTLSKLNDVSLTSDERLELMKKSVDIRRLLNNMTPRNL